MKDITKYDVAILGGGATGMSTATRVRRCRDLSVIVISKDSHVSYSECGIPFKLSGKVRDFDSLIVRTPDFFDKMGIDILLETEAKEIDLNEKKIKLEDRDIGFEKLVIATGGIHRIPSHLQASLELDGVFTLQTLSDGMKIESALLSAENVVVIGAGAIGVEIAAGTAKRGIPTRLINRSSSVLSRLIDTDMSEIVKGYLTSIGVDLITGEIPERIEGEKKAEYVVLSKEKVPADVVIISTGIIPDIEIAKEAGISVGERGGLVTNDNLQVRIHNNFSTDVFAGGDCSEVTELVTGKKNMIQLAPVARRMATVIADNICGKGTTLGPVLGPSVYVAGDLLIGSVGLTSRKAETEDIGIVTGYAKGVTHATFYPGSSDIHIKLLFREQYLVGAQVIAKDGVKERIDSLAFMIKKKTTVDEMLTMETCYAPPVATVVDPLLYAVKDAFRKMRNNNGE
ncbi:FAD-dependent oxidoreductase [Methanococcoides orientis]|uniref:FAD-dependent oxidoreductase n=1 Tax=Methanococcoides orientis TaxID=2822137 RepID=UPI001E3CC7EC|nr:FAD-dependent oxidoreductase [Methanococcoides orientis]UGV40425.1 FAD-dependent oxidoreductase [Methanococcoides orientis]